MGNSPNSVILRDLKQHLLVSYIHICQYNMFQSDYACFPPVVSSKCNSSVRSDMKIKSELSRILKVVLLRNSSSLSDQTL